MAEHSANPLDHVVDHPSIELPWFTGPHYELKLDIGPFGGLQITRFMIMELIAAVLMIVILVPVARHISRSPVSRGWFVNMFEAVLLFIRDQVARPGDRRTRSRPVLALSVDCVLLHPVQQPSRHVSRRRLRDGQHQRDLRPGDHDARRGRESRACASRAWPGFWLAIVPHLDVPSVLKPPLWILMFFIEVAGLLIRHFVLGRAFVRQHVCRPRGALGHPGLHPDGLAVDGFYLVMPVSVGGVICLSLSSCSSRFCRRTFLRSCRRCSSGSAVALPTDSSQELRFR